MLWIGLAVFAALMQSVRTAAQKQLASQLDASVVAWIRFVFGLPFALVLFVGLLGGRIDEIILPPLFGVYAAIIAISQLLATWLMVLLLTRRNFAIGSTLVKSEAIFTAILGLVLFSEYLSLLGWLAIGIGILGLLIASLGKFHIRLTGLVHNFDSTSARLGLLAGVLFSIASVCIRQVNLSLHHLGAPISQAVITLVSVLSMQSLIGGCYVLLKCPQHVKRIPKHLKISTFIGLTSMLGSFGWFAAYALQNAAYVKTLGQVEFIFTLLLTWFYFKEKIQPYEYISMLFVAVSAILIIWIG